MHVFVVMAKYPLPGRVKTRLAGPGGLSQDDAARIAAAMLSGLLTRLAALGGDVWLAVTPDETGRQLAADLHLPVATGRIVDQGSGDLGTRIERVWQTVHDATGSPATFLGMDSPDIPMASLQALEQAAARGDDAWIGPTFDGGYWALGGLKPQPGLLAGIDWGSSIVYHQTCDQARQQGIELTTLPQWHDVDEISDLHALRQRLSEDANTATQDDAALAMLASQLERILGPVDGTGGTEGSR